MRPNKFKTTKIQSFLVFIFLFLGTCIYAQNSLKVLDASAGPGEKSVLQIDLTNTDEVVGAEFTLTVPQGLLVSEKESKIIESRKGDHAVYVNIEKNNPRNYHFIILSLSSTPFKAKSGTLLEIPIEIPLNYASGQTHNLDLSGVVLSSKNATDIGSNHVNGKLTIAAAQFPDLTVSGITSAETKISPEGKINVSWKIDNIGERIASGGWIEQISIVSEQTGIEYNLGTVSYDQDLEKKQSVSRSAAFTLPKVLGIEGNVKIKINVVANTAVKEPEELKANNKVTAVSTVVLEKRLYLVFDKKIIDENSTEVIRAALTQSGDRSADKTFALTASQTGQLQFDASVKILKDQSAVVFYIKPIDNTVTDGNRTVKVSVSGNDYPAVGEDIEIIDNEFSVITLTPSKNSATDGETVTVTLTVDLAKTKETKFAITADQSSRWTVPAEITLPAGSKTASFTVTVKNNKVPEPAVFGKITARAEGFVAGNTEVTLKSSNIPAFELEISPETISKGDGGYATYATIKRLDKSDISTSIRLKPSIANALILPETIDFPANVNQKKFNIGAVNNGIVDGTKTVNVAAEVYISSCNCTVPAGTAGAVVSKSITILDSNGPALTVKSNPSTVKAGVEKAAKITIARNTVDTSAEIAVKLSSDSPTIVSIPASVTIPAGKESVDVEINTIIDVNKTGDQTVRIQAEASGFSSGFAWILVTDQNKPDALVEAVKTVAEADGEASVEITTSITNQGFAVLPKGAKIEYFLSKDKSTKNAVLITSLQIDKDIESGKKLDFIKTIKLPQQAGDYFLAVSVNSDQKVNELSYTNNEGYTAIKLFSGYSATASVSKSVYKSGELVAITGSAKLTNNSPAANKEVEITIANEGFVRSYKVKTNAAGNFAYDFEPLQAESGHYTVSAGYPGTKNAVQAEFDIVGFEWTNKPSDYLKWEVVTKVPYKGEFKLKNNSKTPLTNVKIELPANAGFTIQNDALTLAAGQEAVLSYTILADTPSAEQKYYEINFNVVSNEGAKLPILAYYHAKAQTPKLQANPVSINTTMIKGTSRFYELAITNTGAVEAEKVKVDVPNLEWMKLKSAAVIDKIAANETVKIILELIPTDKQQLHAPLTGNLALNPANGGGVSVPFKIETVSESTGSLLVDVVDEYTYNTQSAPHVKGAKVTVRHPFSGAVVAEGVTDENGLFNTAQIPEGYYTLTVSADKHANYQNNILVDPGKVTTQKVFISYQAVSYEWVVKPTEIEDQYQSDLVVKFETNVPKPVIVIDIDNPVLDLNAGESRMSYATVTNHGLIALSNVSFNVDSQGDYKFKLMIEKMDVLNAKSTIIVPILITRTASTEKSTAAGQNCSYNLITQGTYVCETEQNMAAFQPYFVLTCSTPTAPVVGGAPNFNGGGFGPLIPIGLAIGNIVTELPTICTNPCITSTISAAMGCSKIVPLTLASCLLSLATVDNDIINITLALGGCIPFGDAGCYFGLASMVKTCAEQLINGKSTKNSFLQSKYEDFQAMADAETALTNRIKAYLGNDKLLASPNFQNFMKEAASSLDTEKPFSAADIARIKAALSGTDITSQEIDNFCSRWNTTLEAWNKNIKAPNSEYPNIINKNDIEEYDRIRKSLVELTSKRGFISAAELYENDLKEMEEYGKELASRSSVCASVTVKFSQKVTMTREAFEGTLTLNNGSDANSIKDLNLDLLIKDEAGNDMTHLFQINKDAFLSGTGIVGPNSSESGTVIFIPTKDAAPTVPKSYAFGGTLSYLDPNTGERVTVQLFPVTLEVNPSPDLVMHYFMQRDILGDDPLTDKVEPMVPAEMALLIKNEGYGIAKNVQVESVQPEIIENKKGLLIDFEIVGSNFNNEPKQLGLLNVDFGSIEPQKSALGQWWFTSTLLGHFVEYDLKIKHLSSYGNKNLSLIKASYVHELIKSVKVYGEGQDNINDFLVNDIADANDTPDAIYLSNGENEEVYKVNTGTVSNVISPSQLTTTLTMDSSKTGWNYGNMADPGSDKYKLERVVRISDNLELPIENFWQTFVTLKDGLEPKYENKLHFLDKISGLEKYTLYYTPINTNVPKVESFGEVPAKTTKAVESVQVNFNKAINPNTFTAQNVTLIHQGKNIPFDDSLIGKVNDSTYVLNIKTLSIASGYYELTVQCAGIKDLEDNEGVEGKSISWIQIINELGIVQFKKDQVEAQPVNSVEITFNKFVKPVQFTKEKLTLNGQPIDNVSIVTEDNLKYTIVGLSEYNKESGEYELAVDLPSIKAEDNTTGLIVQEIKWKVDIIIPEVDVFTPQYQGALHSQNVTDVRITLNKPIDTFDKNWITLYKGSVNLNADLNVVKQDDLHYLVTGLGGYTQEEGGYKIVVDQTSFKDLAGNLGTGTSSTMWEVKLGKPASPVNMRITPDRGASQTDNITSGTDLSIALKTSADKQTVELYAVTPAGRTLVSTQNVAVAKEIVFPISGYSGKIIFEAVVYDEFGNAGDAVNVETYIDAVDLNCTIVPLSLNNDCSETDALKVQFADEILALAFTKENLIIKSGGIAVSNENLTLTKISDKEFEIKGLDKFTGSHSIGIDLSKLNKKSSGLQGKGIVSTVFEAFENNTAQITGDILITDSNATVTYTADEFMSKYIWNVTGGEIVEQISNTVTIKWTEKGTQTISLFYTTPALCSKDAYLEVKVDASLSVGENPEIGPKGLVLAPVPNNGTFTVLLSGDDGIFELSIYDVNGKQVYRENKLDITDGLAKEIQTGIQSSGMYFLVLQKPGKVYKSKFLVK
ncbi:carboxypeptidase regulatory-like domain-containing protein [Flavobacterium gelatinilyticum]|uniref:carboxypeptidase regulatory-like domain-containing protein n=1 Tax=Flavobacterium gelatinilyticum TaxID=3003260 RepID=UPI002480215A|nr:carboxypeptidase regulatory-like domain-containing protein [Flavobacterium gelatinilyticum]